jgi:hypothetical protein
MPGAPVFPAGVLALQPVSVESVVGAERSSLLAISPVSAVRDFVSRVTTDSNASQLGRPATPRSAAALARPDPAR